MQNYKLLPFFTLVLMFIGCIDKNITPLQNTKTLDIKDYYEIADYDYDNIFIYDSLLIFVSYQDSNFFHIYNKYSLQLIKKVGVKGRGPYEFDFPRSFNTNTSIQNNNLKYCFWEPNLARVYSINFNSILFDNDISNCISTERIDKNILNSRQINILENDKISGISFEPEGPFYIYDKHTKSKIWGEYLPKFNVESRYLKGVYYGSLNSNGKNIAFAPRYIDEVLFYNSKGQLLKNYTFSKLKQPILSKSFSGVDIQSPIYNLYTYGTEKRCYIQRIGNVYDEYLKSNTPFTQFLVFDWEGNLIEVFQINELIQNFCVDESTSEMYCFKIDSTPNENITLLKVAI